MKPRIWWAHASLALFYPAVALVAVLPTGWQPAAGAAVAGGALLAALVALPGYYLDARRLRTDGAAWVPAWWKWALGHLLLAVFVAPFYVLRRRSKVGLRAA